MMIANPFFLLTIREGQNFYSPAVQSTWSSAFPVASSVVLQDEAKHDSAFVAKEFDVHRQELSFLSHNNSVNPFMKLIYTNTTTKRKVHSLATPHSRCSACDTIFNTGWGTTLSCHSSNKYYQKPINHFRWFMHPLRADRCRTEERGDGRDQNMRG